MAWTACIFILFGNKNNNSIIWRATHFLTLFLPCSNVAELLAEIKIIRRRTAPRFAEF
jgi:hypothetical protein